jgi:hypothetical protein
MMRSLLLALCSLLLFPLAGFAQTGIYATYNASNFDVPHVGWKNGATFGLYHDMWNVPLVHTGFDARISFAGSGDNQVVSGAIGPRISLHPHVLPLMPYGEALIGGGHVQFGQGAARTDTAALEYRLLAGADWTILPRIDWRVIEFTYSGYSNMDNQNFNPKTIATGIVLRLP